QEIKPLEFARVLGRQFGKFGLCPFGGGIQLASLEGEGRRFSVSIDQRKLARMVKQRLLLVLPVNIQQERSQFTQSRHCSRLIVDVNAISVVRRNLAPNDEFRAFAIESKPIEVRTHIHFEDGFNDVPALSGANHSSGRLRSRQQSKSVHDDRFSGSGFAGKEIKTFFEMKFELIDEGKISDAKKPQHTRAL